MNNSDVPTGKNGNNKSKEMKVRHGSEKEMEKLFNSYFEIYSNECAETKKSSWFEGMGISIGLEEIKLQVDEKEKVTTGLVKEPEAHKVIAKAGTRGKNLSEEKYDKHLNKAKKVSRKREEEYNKDSSPRNIVSFKENKEKTKSQKEQKEQKRGAR